MGVHTENIRLADDIQKYTFEHARWRDVKPNIGDYRHINPSGTQTNGMERNHNTISRVIDGQCVNIVGMGCCCDEKT